MSRGGSYGGGKSSLGYLFSSDHPPNPTLPSMPNKVVNKPPWGDDNTTEEPPKIPSPSQKPNVTNNYHRAKGQNSNNFITERPSTKVQSVPGGDSSLGYLFGDE